MTEEERDEEREEERWREGERPRENMCYPLAYSPETGRTKSGWSKGLRTIWELGI